MGELLLWTAGKKKHGRDDAFAAVESNGRCEYESLGITLQSNKSKLKIDKRHMLTISCALCVDLIGTALSAATRESGCQYSRDSTTYLVLYSGVLCRHKYRAL